MASNVHFATSLLFYALKTKGSDFLETSIFCSHLRQFDVWAVWV